MASYTVDRTDPYLAFDARLSAGDALRRNP
jgi:hypothetical protein